MNAETPHPGRFTEAQSRAFAIYKEGVGLPESIYAPTDFASMMKSVKAGLDPERLVQFFAQEEAFSPRNLAILREFAKALSNRRQDSSSHVRTQPVRPMQCDAAMLQIIMDWERVPGLEMGLKAFTYDAIADYLNAKLPTGSPRMQGEDARNRVRKAGLTADRPSRQGTHEFQRIDGTLVPVLR